MDRTFNPLKNEQVVKNGSTCMCYCSKKSESVISVAKRDVIVKYLGGQND